MNTNTDVTSVKVAEILQAEIALVELSELQLGLVGGGTGEVVIA